MVGTVNLPHTCPNCKRTTAHTAGELQTLFDSEPFLLVQRIKVGAENVVVSHSVQKPVTRAFFLRPLIYHNVPLPALLKRGWLRFRCQTRESGDRHNEKHQKRSR